MALILVVDDRAVNREFLAMLMGYAGHGVVEAADGAEALALTRRLHPALIICDIVMPTMDGVEFARGLRADAAIAHIPIIFYTASYRIGDARSLARTCGVSAVLTKPSKPQLILDAVAAALGAPSALAVPPLALARSLPAAGPDLNLSLRLSMLIELGMELVAQRDPQQLLDLACRAGQEIFGARYAAVGMVEAAAQRLSRFAAQGFAGEAGAWFASLDARAGHLGAVLHTGTPCRLHGLDGNAASALPAGHPPLGSLLLVPVASALRPYGWFYVANPPDGGDFDATDEQIAVTLAAQLALAYENMLLYDTQQLYVARLKADAAAIGRLNAGLEQQIEARKRVEQALREAKAEAEQASQAKSIFLAHMSHEMRTPLHVIVGLGHLLRRDLADPVQQERLDQLCANSDHLLGIINDILDLSKIDARRLELDRSDFQLDAEVDKVVRMVEERAQEKGLTLTLEFAPPLRGVAVNGDALRLKQVLINLCGNAIKFTDRGTVRLAVDCVDAAAANVTLRFSVADTGIGIAPVDQARLFQMFSQADDSSTRERGGTGLGLAISQRLVALMGGTIEIDSRPGQGSTFSFALVLPRATAAVAEAGAACGLRDASDFHGRRILLVEDHPLGQEILFEMLGDIGCEVEAASDGAEAVECAQARGYDLILMDMQMPRMDGLAATRAIRALPQHRQTPIVALTANVFAEDRVRCLEAGMNDHLAKPVTPAKLVAALGQWLPALAVPDAATPPCENELTRALAQIPGLEVSPVWSRSPQHLSEYCAQLDRFVTLHAQDMARLREHLAAGAGHDAAHQVAHNLQGIAGLMGARRVATLAREIVQGLRAGVDATGIARLAADCGAELARLGEAIRTLPLPAADGSGPGRRLGGTGAP